jgi:hypothetical protein
VLIEIYLSVAAGGSTFGEIDFELPLWWNPLKAKLKPSGGPKMVHQNYKTKKPACGILVLQKIINWSFGMPGIINQHAGEKLS